LGILAFAGDKVVVVLAVVTLKKYHFAIVFVGQNMGGNTIQEPAVVGYN
jgi:hypothetical protein